MPDVDPITGIRRFRERFAAEHNYDIRAMSATLRRISRELGHVTVSPPDIVREFTLPPLPSVGIPVVGSTPAV